MRVCIIAPGFYPVMDGVSVLLEQRLKHISQAGHEVLLLCPDYSQVALYRNWKDFVGNIMPRVTVVPVPSTQFFEEFDLTMSVRAYKVIMEELNKFAPELIHVDEPEKIFMGMGRRAGVNYARKHKIPCIAMYHTNYLEYGEDYIAFLPPSLRSVVYFFFKRLLTFVYHAYDITLVSNRVTEEKIVGWGVRNNRYENLTGIYASRFERVPAQERFFEKEFGLMDVEEKVKLVFCGRLTPDKGWDFTLKALPLLLERIDKNQVAVFILGDGPLKNVIAETLGKTFVRYYLLGRVRNEQVYSILKHCDIFITNSRKENSPVSTLEGAAAGLPVVAPRAGGVIEQIIEGKNGFLYTPDNHEEFCHKVKLLIEDEKLRKTLGDFAAINARKYDHAVTNSNLLRIWLTQLQAGNKAEYTDYTRQQPGIV